MQHSPLKELSLLDSKERANWYLQITYAWQQEFLANKNTHVEHSYTPSCGQYWIDLEAFDDRKNVTDYRRKLSKEDRLGTAPLNLDECTFDSKHLEEFLKLWRQDCLQSEDGTMKCKPLYQLQYVLKTGSNWRGAIGKFHLEIQPNHPNDLIILEGKYPMKRQKNGVCVVDLENFKPTQDLRIWILPSANLGNDSKQPAFSIHSIWQKVRKTGLVEEPPKVFVLS